MNARLRILIWPICLAPQITFLWYSARSAPLETFLVLIACTALFLRAWDRQLHFSFSKLSAPLLCVGISASIAATSFSQGWLGTWGLLFTFLAFFADQQDREQISLMPIGLLFVVPLLVPSAYEDWLAASATIAVATTSRLVFDVLSTPHLVNSEGFVFLSRTVEVFALPFASWRLFVLCGITYGVIRKRNPAVILTCVLFSSFCWYTFCFSILVLHGLAPNAALFFISAGCCFGTSLLFLSFERGVRTLLAPVADESDDSPNANPLIIFWNYLSAKPEGDPKPPQNVTVASVATASIFAAVLQIASLAIMSTTSDRVGDIEDRESPTVAPAAKDAS